MSNVDTSMQNGLLGNLYSSTFISGIKGLQDPPVYGVKLP